MSLRIQNFTIDANDVDLVATFWEHALAWRRTGGDADEMVLEPPAGSRDEGIVPDLIIQRVPEKKHGKNRTHLCLRPENQKAEVERLLALGATRVSVGQGPDATWEVLADPEGNEFCVLRAYTDEELAQLAVILAGR